MAISGPMPAPATGNTTGTTDVRAMSIATALFFMWGLLTSLNDILIPHLKSIFELSYAQAMLVQFAFFSSYFIFALPSGKLVEWRGYKQTMIIGLVIMAVGALLFLPAAGAASYVKHVFSSNPLAQLVGGVIALAVATTAAAIASGAVQYLSLIHI